VSIFSFVYIYLVEISLAKFDIVVLFIDRDSLFMGILQVYFILS